MISGGVWIYSICFELCTASSSYSVHKYQVVPDIGTIFCRSLNAAWLKIFPLKTDEN